jgi:deoxyribodipyrimidine photo-lyase
VSAIVWFRRDLRLHDHPALREALAGHDEVVPLFCLDDRLLRGRHASGPRTQFLLESLEDLDGSLRSCGGRLVLRRGPAERVLPELAEEVGAEAVYFTRDVGPFARSRDRGAVEALRAAGVETHARPGVTVVDYTGDLQTNDGRPYTVFSPFHRRWLAEPRRGVLPAPRKLKLPTGVDGDRMPKLGDLGLEQEVEDPVRGGEAEARRRLTNFMRGPVERYRTGQDTLADDATSRLSAYLHLGCVSPREVESKLPGGGDGPQAFRRQLCWRDFYHQVLLTNPRNAHEEHQSRYRGTLPWPGDDELFDAWREGRTGYPLVDAGMRQLWREGFMHNRARLVTASFLTKELGIDWRRGEQHFMRLLLDGDEANNNGNWQWVTSVGVDPAPYFRRIFNPARHMERFDPDGRYVRRYVPELEKVPDRYLAEPWEMPGDVQEAYSCVIGRDYPAPVVDRKAAREDAIERYRAAAAEAA